MLPDQVYGITFVLIYIYGALVEM